MKNRRFSIKWLLVTLIVLSFTLGLGQSIFAANYGLGDIPLDKETYRKFLKTYPDKAEQALQPSYDARNDGIVTPAKDQGDCGSCWAFGSAGAMESHLLKKFGFGPADLSEQQLVSCDLSMLGCCGGSSAALRYWESDGPIYESCFPYAESGTSCPAIRTVNCSEASGCERLPYNVVGWHTVAEGDFNTSLYEEGPSYWRFDVYEDFFDFWDTGNPGDVYTNSYGSYAGGHAVLIIGWDDVRNAYLCKNSWGATAGPNGDGTFWIAYTGHAHNLDFGMTNFDLTGEPQECDYCLEDSMGLEWCMNVIDQDSDAIYLSGTVDMGYEIRSAVATFLKKNSGVRMCADAGSGCPFTYNWKLQGSSGSGVWINVHPAAGHGTVEVWMCGKATGTKKSSGSEAGPGSVDNR